MSHSGSTSLNIVIYVAKCEKPKQYINNAKAKVYLVYSIKEANVIILKGEN
jgi:hypothetical protein